MIMPSESETGKIHNTPRTGKSDQKSPKKKSSRRRPATGLHFRQLIRFTIDNAEFGVDIGQVREIRRASDMTVKGNESSDVIGVIAAPDGIIDVVDLGRCLGYPPRPIRPISRVVIFQHGDMVRAAVVDEVTEVLRLEHTVEDKSGNCSVTLDPGLVREVLVVDEKKIIVLDWARVLKL
jgi:purine-binding chemotaxis protein CheW